MKQFFFVKVCSVYVCVCGVVCVSVCLFVCSLLWVTSPSDFPALALAAEYSTGYVVLVHLVGVTV